MLHGVKVADPFRGLEDGASADTTTWVEAQNRRTRAVLDALPRRAELHRRSTDLLRAGTSTACQVAGPLVFSLDRWGDLDQEVLVCRPAGPGDGGAQPPRVLVDPRAATGDPTAAVDWYHPSPDGELLAYGVSRGGDERSTLHVLDVATNQHRPDEIAHTRAASVAWLPDAQAFAYTRYPDPGEVAPGDEGYWRRVWWHRLGEDPGADGLLFDALPDKTAWPDVSLSPDGRWLLVHVAVGWSRVDIHLLDRADGRWVTVVEGEEAITRFRVVGNSLIGHTTLGADRGRAVRAPLASPTPEQWFTLVAESESVIEATTTTARSLLVLSTRSAVSRLHRYELDGGGGREVPLPELGSLEGLTGSRDDDVAFFAFTSFARPPALFRWEGGAVERWSELDTAVDPAAYRVEQVRYRSTDGTEIAMFLVRGGGEGEHVGPDTPAVLTGYGGFGVTLGPAYSPAVVSVCEDGGLYAVANVRGGAEEGEAWHRAGMGRHKQQVFDDFCAAADWLVDQGLTSRERLAIRGGSNGGLLVGAALTQRPDLCRAVHCAVPLLDMVRFPRFLIARLWVPEYGDPDVAEELAWLYAYSPYHRVVDGTCYPAVLLTTAEEDSRVDPAHARKMAARLQEATSCGDERPVLLRVEERAGHGQGKPVTKEADELADVLAFLSWQLNP